MVKTLEAKPNEPLHRIAARVRFGENLKGFGLGRAPERETLALIIERPVMSNLQPIRNVAVENIHANRASEFCRHLLEWIHEFDASLDATHEVGVRLVSFGQTVIFHLAGLGYANPSLIAFSGETEGGDPVELIQHVSQISLLLMKLPRKNPDAPKKPIGFYAIQTEKEDE